MNRRPALILATSVAALLSGHSARATDYTLNVSNTATTTNSWDTTTIWTPNGVPNSTADSFKFTEATAVTTTLNLDVGSRTVRGIVVTGGNNDNLVIASPNASPNNYSLILDAGGAGTLATVNSGNGGTPTTKLAISAPISINSNVQFVDNATPFQTSTSSMNVTGAITGTGNITIGVKSGANASFGGGINNVGTLTIGNTAAATVAGTATTALTNAGTTQVPGVVGTNVTGVTVNNGTLLLSGANTYTSTTAVNGGTLLYNGSVGTTAVPAGAVTVATGGRLGGTGLLTVASATVDAGGTLAPGATTGATTGALTLNTTSGLTLNGTLAIGITATGSSLLTTTGGLTLGAGSILTVTGTSGLAAYDLVNYAPGTLSGTFAKLTIPTGYTVNYAGTDFGSTSIELVTAVPEPSTWVGGIACLGFMGFRLLGARRQSRRETQAA